MLSERLLFKTFWSTVNFFGLQPSQLTRREKIRAFAIFVMCFVANAVLMIVSSFTSEDIDDKVHGIQTLPVLFLIVSDVSNFIRKREKIQKFFTLLDDTLSDTDNGAICRSVLRSANGYFVHCVLTMSVSVTINLVTFAVTGKSGIPTLNFSGGFGFAVVWTIQAMFVVYTGAIYVLLDVFMCSMLFVIVGYFEYQVEEVKRMSVRDAKKIVRMHSEVRELLAAYTDLFSTVLLLRGFLNTLALSSIVLDIVDKGVSSMSLNVMLFGLNGLFKLYTPCVYGSRIESCAEKFSMSFYETEWLKMTGVERKNFLILQQNLKQALGLKAMRIVEINVETFVGILQWTYSLYSMFSVLKK